MLLLLFLYIIIILKSTSYENILRIMLVLDSNLHFRVKCGVIIKGAVCRILTLLKHKNTIICLQICKKHAKLIYLFIWKTML